jgi:chromosome segregation ATPase
MQQHNQPINPFPDKDLALQRRQKEIEDEYEEVVRRKQEHLRAVNERVQTITIKKNQLFGLHTGIEEKQSMISEMNKRSVDDTNKASEIEVQLRELEEKLLTLQKSLHTLKQSIEFNQNRVDTLRQEMSTDQQKMGAITKEIEQLYKFDESIQSPTSTSSTSSTSSGSIESSNRPVKKRKSPNTVDDRNSKKQKTTKKHKTREYVTYKKDELMTWGGVQKCLFTKEKIAQLESKETITQYGKTPNIVEVTNRKEIDKLFKEYDYMADDLEGEHEKSKIVLYSADYVTWFRDRNNK